MLTNILMRNRSAALVFSLPALLGIYQIIINYTYDLPGFLSGESAYMVCYDSLKVKTMSNNRSGTLYAYGYLPEQEKYVSIDLSTLAYSRGEPDEKKLEKDIRTEGVCQKTYFFHTGGAITIRTDTEVEIRRVLNNRTLFFLLTFLPIVAYGILVVIYETIIKTIKRIQGVDDSDSEP